MRRRCGRAKTCQFQRFCGIFVPAASVGITTNNDVYVGDYADVDMIVARDGGPPPVGIARTGPWDDEHVALDRWSYDFVRGNRGIQAGIRERRWSPACSTGRMAHPFVRRASLTAVAASLLAFTHRVAAQETQAHVRPLNRDIGRVFADGVDRSPTLRALAAAIEATDVYVYIDHAILPEGLRGRMQFVAAAGGRRYVRIEIDCRQMVFAQIATIGHELQHAGEIADAPAVVDNGGVARLYRRIGFQTGRNGDRFDTARAIAAGTTVLREVTSPAERQGASGARERLRPDDGAPAGPGRPIRAEEAPDDERGFRQVDGGVDARKIGAASLQPFDRFRLDSFAAQERRADVVRAAGHPRGLR